MIGDLNINGHRILNLKTARWVKKMTGNLGMNNKQINNLPLPTGNNQPTTKIFTDLTYLHRDGTAPMGGNLNMNNKSIKH